MHFGIDDISNLLESECLSHLLAFQYKDSIC
nr:MAG TPA: hypothetical protein [Caudoviricetes sp.]